MALFERLSVTQAIIDPLSKYRLGSCALITAAVPPRLSGFMGYEPKPKRQRARLVGAVSPNGFLAAFGSNTPRNDIPAN